MMRFLFPHVVVRTSSRYNPDIRVIHEWGGNKLLVNGSRQSGPYIRKLWEATFRAFRLESVRDIRSILVLGIGGGTVIDHLSSRYPHAMITAVDIDQTMIAIAKEYFHLDRIPKLSIRCEDAHRYVLRKKHFDLIIIDLFIGREIPAFVGGHSFYQHLKRMLAPEGMVVINYLKELTYRQKSDELFLNLSRVFPHVRDFPISNNRFFLCRT